MTEVSLAQNPPFHYKVPSYGFSTWGIGDSTEKLRVYSGQAATKDETYVRAHAWQISKNQ